MRDSKRTFVPTLRFPDFRDGPEWEIKPLSDIAENLDNKRVPITENKRTKGDVPYYGASGVVDYVKEHLFDEDLLCVSEDGANLVTRTYPIAFPISGKTWVNNHAHVLRFDNAATQRMVEGYLNSTDLRDFITGMAQPKLNRGMLESIPVPLPPTGKEQERVADCLTSLDEVIAAQGGKVEALKAHKQGLMQELFPREGESLPRLRFPEFREGPEWTTHPFEHFVLQSFYGTSSSTSEKGEYPVLRMGNMVDGGLNLSNLAYIDLDRESFEAICLMRGDILLNRTNSLDLVGKISLFDLDMEVITASYIVTYRPDQRRIDPSFCNFILNSPPYQRKIKALARPSVSQANINPTTFRKELSIAVPSLIEQRLIADCLASIDVQIVAGCEKLDTVRAHKLGLMQQLFPSLERD
ncbi:MAG: putative type restriction-modification system restriction subunit [Gammaproteobacteria bacterium]|nr:putative type restriction-modification system restriction subunit [Gammaproteobacteria bacterium]